MGLVFLIAAIVAWVLGLANVSWFGASELDWGLVGLICYALSAAAPAVVAFGVQHRGPQG